MESILELKSTDGVDLKGFLWLPEKENEVKWVVQIAHGMAEHAVRYRHFAEWLNKHDIAVVSFDYRGHGKTAGDKTKTGHFAHHDGWKLVVGDIALFNRFVRQRFPKARHILFGHSMGSFFVRAYLHYYPDTAQAFVLSGTAFQEGLLLTAGSTIAAIQRFFTGPLHRSKLLHSMAFSAHNKRFEPAQTPVDWLSRDIQQCSIYDEDEMCGFVCTTAFYQDLFCLLKFIRKPGLYANVPKNIPVFIIAGENDPVGDFSKGPLKVEQMFRKAGFTDVERIIYPGARHEILNETNRTEVYNDILSWILKRSG